MQLQTFYISSNKSRPFEDKYGIYHNNRYNRLLDNHEQFSHLSRYENLYNITETNNYKLTHIKEYDKLISKYAIDIIPI